MPKVSTQLKKLKTELPKPVKNKPVWEGPIKQGITQSLLGRFLVCRERFRLLTVEGLREADKFSHSLEYGQMWHECEESRHRGGDWEKTLREYVQHLTSKYRDQQDEVVKWYHVCRTQFPIYLDYWKNQSEEQNRKSLLQEFTFRVPYKLPSNRIVMLMGKWDNVELVTEGKGKKKKKLIWLEDHKTKGDISEEQLTRRLGFDLQTLFYLVALRLFQNTETVKYTGAPIAGVKYNVVRRPLSGGKGSIRQHKPTKSNPRGETRAEFLERLGGIIRGDPGYYFMKLDCRVTNSELDKFCKQFLTPQLEQLCDWWEWMTTVSKSQPELDPFDNPVHFRAPYGYYNPVAEGRFSEIDHYLDTGSSLGLEKVETLFPELD